MSTGDGSSMWPEGCNTVDEVPNDLLSAFSHACYILRASENFMEDEQPPDWVWAFPEELEAHFERIKRERKKKFGGDKGQSDDSEDSGWVQNEYAKNLR